MGSGHTAGKQRHPAAKMVGFSVWMLVGLLACGWTSCSAHSLIPDQQDSQVVHCDIHWACPDGTTCCHHPKGGWFCCPYSPGRCCLDGYHCCPYGYDCDHTYTHCVRDGLTYPFTPKQPAASHPAFRISTSEEEGNLKETVGATLTVASVGTDESEVVRCDFKTSCPSGTKCCRGPTGRWTCCPFALGQCCRDGIHCCQFGYTCDPSSTFCRRGYSQIPSGAQENAIED